MPPRISRLPLAAAAVAVLAAAAPARAWNRAGHEAIAVLAYRDLAARDPAALRAALALLRAHPEYELRWRDEIAAAGPRSDDDLHLFMRALRWADDVHDHRHDGSPDGEPGHNAWHWTDRQFDAAGGKHLPPETPNLEYAFAHSRERFLSTSLPQRQRAEALAWALHLAADAHAPLHTVSFVSPAFPHGDGGGNLSWVMWGTRPVRLHWLWDRLLLGPADDFEAAKQMAVILQTRPAPSPEALAETRFEAWVADSHRIGVELGYLRGTLAVSATAEGARPLPEGYVTRASAAAERQAVLAARHIADLVSLWF